MMQKTFIDLKVVELASVLAGPATGMFFAEMGARVVKFENKKTGGDITRKWLLPKESPNKKISAYYSSVNWGKKVIFSDLANEKDYKKLISYIKKADVVITNYKKGDDKKLKVDYGTLKKINPKIIYAHISAFGEDSSRTAFDLVLQAETGFMSMNGTAQSGPLKMPVALIDVLAAHQLKEGILTALIRRMKTKKGCKVSVSLYDAGIASLVNQAANYLQSNNTPSLQGSLHPNIAPYGEIFTTKDNKQITFAIGSDEQFFRLSQCIGKPSMSSNKLFARNQMRIKNRASLFKAIQTAVGKFYIKSLVSQLKKQNIPYGEVKNLKEVFHSKKSNYLILSNEDDFRIVRSVAFKMEL